MSKYVSILIGSLEKRVLTAIDGTKDFENHDAVEERAEMSSGSMKN